MLTIYHARGTRGLRLIWLCEELGLPYAVERVDFSAEYRATPQWRQMNPVGKVPVLRDGALTLFESGAMLQYVLDRYGEGRLQPERGSPEHGLFLQWCWFAEATFGRATGEMANHKRAFAEAPLTAVLEEMKARARLCLQALEQGLGEKSYLLGESFSAADVMMGYTLQSFDNHVGDAHPPNVAGYAQRLRQRPGYLAAKRREAELG